MPRKLTRGLILEAFRSHCFIFQKCAMWHILIGQCHFSFLLKLFFYKIAIIVSSSSNSDKREIDEYHDESNNSSSSGSDSSVSSSSDEHYSSVVPGVPLEVLQEELRQRMTSSSLASLSFHVPVFSPLQVKRRISYIAAQ